MQLICCCRNAIEVSVGERPATSDHHDVLDPELTERMTAVDKPLHRFIRFQRG